MINMRTGKKGFVLIIVMVFSIITLVASAALFMGISATYKVAGVGEAQSIKGYYAAHAGARYAYVMLQDPAIMSQLVADGNSVTVHANAAPYDTLYADLNLQAPHDITITITYRLIPATKTDDYLVTSTYT